MTRFLPVPEFPGYVVGDNGTVLGKRGYALKTPLDGWGYPKVCLRNSSGQVVKRVHKLVALAFLGEANGRVVRHLDGQKLNNSVSNLRYGTAAENAQDSMKHGTHYQAAKTHCKRGHEFTEKNTYQTSKQRFCRVCRKLRARQIKGNARLQHLAEEN